MNSWQRSRRRIAVVLGAIVIAAGLGAPAEAIGSGHVRATVSVPRGVENVVLEAELFRKVGGHWVAARRNPTSVSSSGRLAVGGLKSGTYRLRISDATRNVLAEYYDNHRTFAGSTTFKVRRGHVTRLRPVRLTRAAHIRGRVTDAVGHPVRAAEVTALQRRDGAWVSSGVTVAVERDGTYDVPGLRSGAYRISITDESQKYIGEFWPNASSAETATAVRVKTGQVVKHRNARLELASRISGVVTADDGLPFAGQELVSVLRRIGGTWKRAGTVTVADAGGYVVKGLSAGTYRIRFHHDLGDYAEEFWDDATVLDRAKDVVVPAASSVAGKDAVVTRTADPGGRVQSPSGVALADIAVTAHRPVPGAPGRWEVAATTTTTPQPYARQANFRFRLAPGTYRFTFADPAGAYAPVLLESAPEVVVVRNQPGWPPVTTLQPGTPPPG